MSLSLPISLLLLLLLFSVACSIFGGLDSGERGHISIKASRLTTTCQTVTVGNRWPFSEPCGKPSSPCCASFTVGESKSERDSESVQRDRKRERERDERERERERRERESERERERDLSAC